MRKTLLTQRASIWFAIGAVVLAQCLMVQVVAFSEDKDQSKYPPTLTPHETVVDDTDKDKKEGQGPRIPRLACGKCPEGYVKTAVAAPHSGLTPGANFDSSEMCQGLDKSEGSTLVECKPIGTQNQMPVCGLCPEGYREVGRTLLPALCGNEDGGLRTQCQVPKMEGGMPDPTKGGRKCPPDCVGNLPTPGQGFLPLPPKIPSIEIRKEKPEESP